MKLQKGKGWQKLTLESFEELDYENGTPLEIVIPGTVGSPADPDNAPCPIVLEYYDGELVIRVYNGEEEPTWRIGVDLKRDRVPTVTERPLVLCSRARNRITVKCESPVLRDNIAIDQQWDYTTDEDGCYCFYLFYEQETIDIMAKRYTGIILQEED